METPKEIEMSANPAKAPKKRRFGKASDAPLPIPGMEGAPTPPAPPQLNHKVYVSFYYDDKNGDTGFGNIVLSNISDIRTQSQLEQVIASIGKERGDNLKDIQILFWKSLEA